MGGSRRNYGWARTLMHGFGTRCLLQSAGLITPNGTNAGVYRIAAGAQLSRHDIIHVRFDDFFHLARCSL